MAVRARIQGGDYFNFVSGSISLNYSSVASTFTLTSPFNSEDPIHKNLFKPLAFYDVQIYDEFDSLMITGTIANVAFEVTAKGTVATLSGYSKPGVLIDCTAISDSPAQFDKLSLRELAEKLCDPYGITVEVDALAEDNADKVAETVDVFSMDSKGKVESIDTLLKRRCSEAGLILSHDNLGRLLITKRNLESPTIATYREDIPAVSLGLTVDGTSMHRKITVAGETSYKYDVESNPEQSIINDLIPVTREILKTQKTSTDARDDSPLDLAKAHRAEQLRNIKLSIASDRWYWWDGKARYETIKPNNLIDVIADHLYLANRTKFL